MKNIFQGKKNNLDYGFTLVELMVVVAIIAVISALSLFNSSKLNSSVLLSNTAYEIGLIIRDAQVSGLGARVMSATVDGSTFATTSNQGVYFDTSAREKIVFFADLDKDNKRNITGSEDSQVYNIENKRAGNIIRICEVNGTICDDISDLTIMFKRPNPEAYFYDTTHPTHSTGIGFQGTVVVNVGFDGGDCRSIIIYKTGAIQIDKSYCNN